MTSSTLQYGRLTASLRLLSTCLAAALTLAACGGGGGSAGTLGNSATGPLLNPPAGTSTPEPDVATLGDAFATYWNMCAKPRTGTDPYTGKPYPDKQGTLRDELTFLRAWSNQYYLWYNEIPTNLRMSDYTNPVDYFDKLMSPRDKDMYHFTYPTAEWDKLTNSGIELGYGITWSSGSATAPRVWRVAIVEPGSPAAAAGLRRGDQLTLIDGADFVNGKDAATVDKINAGLFPSTPGAAHNFSLMRDGANIAVTMQAQEVTASSVKNTKVIDTPSGKVGYLSFENHNAVAERQLIESFTTLQAAGVKDLVLDLRYNGGGYLAVAAELGYMVAGPDSTGKVFERLQYNSKIEAKQAPQIIRFESTAAGFDAGAGSIREGAPLPTLGLKRVTVLTTSGTCSASEAVINGLRGIDVEVNVIGDTTCGKPYGFTPVPNCGTTYFSVEFQGVNAKGFGDFGNGIAPTCPVADDLAHELGDPNEALLASALSYRDTRTCPARTSSVVSGSTLAKATALGAAAQVRPRASQIAIHRLSR
jgi:C-terminal processing protease CtpA/Prc